MNQNSPFIIQCHTEKSTTWSTFTSTCRYASWPPARPMRSTLRRARRARCNLLRYVFFLFSWCRLQQFSSTQLRADLQKCEIAQNQGTTPRNLVHNITSLSYATTSNMNDAKRIQTTHHRVLPDAVGRCRLGTPLVHADQSTERAKYTPQETRNSSPQNSKIANRIMRNDSLQRTSCPINTRLRQHQ